MRYRHALLVEPTGDSKGYRGVNVHAGGIAWYGRYLDVADTEQGIRVFDMYHLFDLGAGAQTNSTAYTNVTDNTRVGIDNNGTPRNTYYGYGYRFLIPQIATWRQAGTVNPHKQLDSNSKEMSYLCAKGSVPNEDSSGMRFSWLTVDRSPTKTFAAGEFCRDYGSAHPGNRGRMAQWNADAIHSRTVDRKDGESVSPIYAWRLPAYSVQGAAHAGPYWYFNRSIGCNPAIQTVRRRLGTEWSGTVQWTSAIGAEDLYLERPPNGYRSSGRSPSTPTCTGPVQGPTTTGESSTARRWSRSCRSHLTRGPSGRDERAICTSRSALKYSHSKSPAGSSLAL